MKYLLGMMCSRKHGDISCCLHSYTLTGIFYRNDLRDTSYYNPFHKMRFHMLIKMKKYEINMKKYTVKFNLWICKRCCQLNLQTKETKNTFTVSLFIIPLVIWTTVGSSIRATEDQTILTYLSKKNIFYKLAF